MIMGNKLKKALKGDFIASKKSIKLTVAESVRMIREMNELSQNELAELTDIPQSTISGIESGRINLGVERAKVLARALKIHPAVILFPSWDTAKESVA
jgi:transcriptional regulator with XRE-family HTH domain